LRRNTIFNKYIFFTKQNSKVNGGLESWWIDSRSMQCNKERMLSFRNESLKQNSCINQKNASSWNWHVLTWST